MNIYYMSRNYRDIDLAVSDCSSCRYLARQRKGPPGFSLAELMMAIALGLILLGAIYSLFTNQHKILGTQEQQVVMQHNARIALDMMVRDIQMAGSNPTLTQTLPKCTGTMPDSLINASCIGILSAGSSEIKFNMDTSNTAGASLPDGATDGPNETITYGLYTSTDGGVSVQCLGRKNTSDSEYRRVMENVESLSFGYQDASGGNATNIGNIRIITITLVARAAKYDPSYPQNSGYRTYTLQSQVTPRNLGY